MTGRRGPLAVARTAVDLAALVLPTPDARKRYRAEFRAELAGMRPAQQLRHATGLLATSFALRTALGAPSPAREDAMSGSAERVPFWRCRVFRLHRWAWHSTEDGGLYEACAECGEDRGPAGKGMMTTPPWPGRR